jgi:uncharacterized protein DUF5989
MARPLTIGSRILRQGERERKPITRAERGHVVDILVSASHHDMSIIAGVPMKRDSVAKEFVRFVVQNKKWWLTPIILVFLLLMGVAVLGSTGAVPIMYTIF